jgi:hypothetical protein
VANGRFSGTASKGLQDGCRAQVEAAQLLELFIIPSRTYRCNRREQQKTVVPAVTLDRQHEGKAKR